MAATPRFAGQGLDPGYLTTKPGARGQLFYYLPTADPRVLALDEATKETYTASEVAGALILLANGISAQIDVPVLVVVGQDDSFFCAPTATDCSSSAAVQQAEAPYYAPQAHLQAVIIADFGHDLNLQETAPTFYAVA